MGQKIVQVDAFTTTPFAGNPAAVCVLSEPRSDEWLQLVAREMNLPDTAFLTPRADGSFHLRWFTPAAEVALCGHATLASAHALWQSGQLQLDETARFHTLSGLLTAQRRGEWIEMDFPASISTPIAAPAGLWSSLGLEATNVVYCGKNQFDYLVVVDAEELVRNLHPNFTELQTLDGRGVIVTSRAASQENGYDFVSRFFCPRVGVNEDPVTGSTHCALAPYWCQTLGQTQLTGYQASARGGFIRVELAGERVLLQGQAVTVLRGELV